MSRPARWECSACRRLLADIDRGRLRLARAVEVIYPTRDGCVVVCPGCEQHRTWTWDAPVAQTTAAGM